MTIQRVNVWLLLAFSAAVLVLFVADGSSATAAIESGGVFSRLRRNQKPTHATAAPQDASRSPKTLLKGRASPLPPGADTSADATAKAAGSKTADTAASLRQRLDQTVQKVRARSKELKMEQEQKRVDRKLRRDQKKLERDQAAPAGPINPHNLQMPDCPPGKVYNGRRCVPSSKTPKH